MTNFTYDIPTKVYFGKGQITHLAELRESGERVLLVYGGGSIKTLGIYDLAKQILQDNGVSGIYELGGIQPNPKIESVREGVKICKENNIQMVLAIGGGSTIDAAKVIAAGALYDGDPWDLVLYPDVIQEALPIYTVLTLAATGSEMDAIGVISDMSQNMKKGTHSPFYQPKMSILDPEFTYTVPANQTAAGSADIMSHIIENYFTNESGSEFQTNIAEALMKTVIHYAPIALKEPMNYDARANLMWASSWAINGLISLGAKVKWSCHPMEHELSAFYDITHGVGLAILTPCWMDYVLNEVTKDKFAHWGEVVWGLPHDEDEMATAKKAIQCLRDWNKSLNLPSTLTEVGIGRENFEMMAEKAAKGCVGSFVPLEKEDIIKIFEAAL